MVTSLLILGKRSPRDFLYIHFLVVFLEKGGENYDEIS